jgi:molecular chaperone DnaK
MSGGFQLGDLLPASGRPKIDLAAQSFVGIDFGTSTTVVSVATLSDEGTLNTEIIRIPQEQRDGAQALDERLPSVIAWVREKLLVGRGAAELKDRLSFGKNLWHSFKMELGKDVGPSYYASDLGPGHAVASIACPGDATNLFFRYIEHHLADRLEAQGHAQCFSLSVSIPAAFEANQRSDLVDALSNSGLPISANALIDEPNAAFLSYFAGGWGDSSLRWEAGKALTILVFDFGAGTCDISVLEVAKKISGLHSRNLSISKFEKLGGNDIDRALAERILLPQLCKENACSLADFTRPELNRRLLPALLGPAERLKISICETIALASTGGRLARKAGGSERLALGSAIRIKVRDRDLKLAEPSCSFREFADLMSEFIDGETQDESAWYEDPPGTMHELLKSALTKASRDRAGIDGVLLIGGSCKNPWVQEALREYFSDSELIVPADLQAHVARGTAIHSLLLHGYGKETIQSITSEAIFLVTRDETLYDLVPAGTPIPAPPVAYRDLVPQRDGQRVIELPICVGERDRILHTIRLERAAGFSIDTVIEIACGITHDKLVEITASAGGESVEAKALNPYANRPLTPAQRQVLAAEKAANEDAQTHRGKPSRVALLTLAQAYAVPKAHLRAAETYELLHRIYGDTSELVNTGYHYRRAGRSERAEEWEQKAYERAPCVTSVFNLALNYRIKDPSRYEALMKEALTHDPKAPFVLHVYGGYLLDSDRPDGRALVQQAFDIFRQRFDDDVLLDDDYWRFEDCAEILGDAVTASLVAQRWKERKRPRGYDLGNLARQFKQQ